MEKLIIEGGRPLSGTVYVHGSKNAALPILAASIMVEGNHRIENVPDLLDIHVMLQILTALGCRTEYVLGKVTIDTTALHSWHIPDDLMKQMRSSIFLMGPMLARFGRVKVHYPGGCAIGERKIDLHLKGLEALGAKIEESGNTIECRTERLRGTEISLDYPSVGATENIMMAAATAEGTTVIYNVAKEPEIVDLQNYLNAMGAQITGAGTDTIMIRGVNRLKPRPYRIIPDRIVAGTMMVAAAVAKGSITVKNAIPSHLTSVIHVLRNAGVQVTPENDAIHVQCFSRPKRIDRIVTAPYPAFPTDLQSQFMVLLSLADGLSVIKETVFENRFNHVGELLRMGADIRVDLNSAFIRGIPRLYGANVEATDLRAGAALVIAGLAAKGTTVIGQIHHIDRGYERIECMFQQLGANIERLAPVSKAL